MKSLEHNQVYTGEGWQTLNLSGAVVRVDKRAPGVLDVWSETPEVPQPYAGSFRAFEAGDMIPDGAQYRGAAAWSTTSPMYFLYEQDMQ